LTNKGWYPLQHSAAIALLEVYPWRCFASVFHSDGSATCRPIPEALLPVVKLLLFVGVLGAATTMVAMEYFLFSFDHSSDMQKVFWLCVILFPLLAPLSTEECGACILF
jgi:hypothetical protein